MSGLDSIYDVMMRSKGMFIIFSNPLVMSIIVTVIIIYVVSYYKDECALVVFLVLLTSYSISLKAINISVNDKEKFINTKLPPSFIDVSI